ncbi:GNAT family N-acetyltransferase [Stackebrandtia soli]|uniref:GNAT family N-acetyltransferase n=1 Tax=Stackebrandtia soli TaxID=1892856 RepID=UPI0039E92BA3
MGDTVRVPVRSPGATVTVDIARPGDRAGFLALAADVEHWFGPMVDVPAFHSVLDRTIADGRALCVRAGTGLAGGLLVSGTATRFHIDWLVVDTTARRGGTGRALLAEAFRRFVTPPAVVDVVTFGADHPAAIEGGARTFYERLGFVPGERARPGPEGGSRQHYRLTMPTE